MILLAEAFVVDLTARNKLGVPVTLNGVNIVFDAIEGDCQPGDLVSDTIPLVTLEPNSSTRVCVVSQLHAQALTPATFACCTGLRDGQSQ